MSISLPPALPATGSDRQPSNPGACKDPSLHTIIVRFSFHAKQDKVCDRDTYAIGVAGPTSRLKENFDAYLSAIKDSEKAIGRINIA